jgi:hypothetical protein
VVGSADAKHADKDPNGPELPFERGAANYWSARFSAVADALKQLPDGTIVDGELVFLDGEGSPVQAPG